MPLNWCTLRWPVSLGGDRAFDVRLCSLNWWFKSFDAKTALFVREATINIIADIARWATNRLWSRLWCRCSYEIANLPEHYRQHFVFSGDCEACQRPNVEGIWNGSPELICYESWQGVLWWCGVSSLEWQCLCSANNFYLDLGKSGMFEHPLTWKLTFTIGIISKVAGCLVNAHDAKFYCLWLMLMMKLFLQVGASHRIHLFQSLTLKLVPSGWQKKWLQHKKAHRPLWVDCLCNTPTLFQL